MTTSHRRYLSPGCFFLLFAYFAGTVGLAADNASRTLFGNRAVQRELGLSEEQQKKIDKILADIEQQIALEMKARGNSSKDVRDLADREEEVSDAVLAKQ